MNKCLLLGLALCMPLFLRAQNAGDQQKYKKAVEFYNAGEYDEAVKIYTDLLSRSPDNANIYTARGAAYDQMGNHDKSIEDENQAISLDPSNASAFVNLATAYGAKGNFDKAIEADNQAIKLDPRNEAAYSDLVNAYSQKKQYDKALECLNKSVELGSDDAQTLNNAARFLATCPDDNLRDGPRAVKLAQQGCDTDKTNLACRNALAAAYAEIGDFKKAIQVENDLLATPNLDSDIKSRAESQLALLNQGKPIRFTPDNQ